MVRFWKPPTSTGKKVLPQLHLSDFPRENPSTSTVLFQAQHLQTWFHSTGKKHHPLHKPYKYKHHWLWSCFSSFTINCFIVIMFFSPSSVHFSKLGWKNMSSVNCLDAWNFAISIQALLIYKIWKVSKLLSPLIGIVHLFNLSFTIIKINYIWVRTVNKPYPWILWVLHLHYGNLT